MKAIYQATIENLPLILQSIKEAVVPLGVSPRVLNRLELASEEAIMNIIEHAYQKQPKEMEIEIRLFPKDRAEILFKDSGPPFNPLKAPVVDPFTELEERKIGGLGIHFIRQLVDEVTYQRVLNSNILTLIIRLSSQKE
jgi:anti-sigma regulatory factor (Ser/Thr protein kinase)